MRTLTQSGSQAVTCVDIPGTAYEAELVKHLPPVVAKMLAGMAAGVKQNEFKVPSSTLEKLLGRALGKYISSFILLSI